MVLAFLCISSKILRIQKSKTLYNDHKALKPLANWLLWFLAENVCGFFVKIWLNSEFLICINSLFRRSRLTFEPRLVLKCRVPLRRGPIYHNSNRIVQFQGGGDIDFPKWYTFICMDPVALQTTNISQVPYSIQLWSRDIYFPFQASHQWGKNTWKRFLCGGSDPQAPQEMK